MPWGFECKAKLIKQLPAKPTERKGKVLLEFENPGPNCYESPELFCYREIILQQFTIVTKHAGYVIQCKIDYKVTSGKGYSHIKRSPAFTFGHYARVKNDHSVILPSAPMLDISGMGYKGSYKIKHGIISPVVELPREKVKMPGPCSYAPNNNTRYKKSPEYSMRLAARPPYQPWDQWTPPPNMYLPYMPGKKRPPAFSMGNMGKSDIPQNTPDPGAIEPNFNYIKKRRPAYSFAGPYRSFKPTKVPPPNAHCEKKFMYTKRTIPAPSFGIRHSPYLGKQAEYLKPEDLNIIISGED